MKVGALVVPRRDHENGPFRERLGVVLESHEYPEDDLAGPVCYQIWWGGEIEWWMPDELIVVAE